MSEKRTFAIGDIHGDLDALFKVLACLPTLTKDDTIVFVGDYIDRGPKSAQVVDYVRKLSTHIPAKVVCLRGNHEDAWLRVLERGGPGYVLPPVNGCLACMRSCEGKPPPDDEERATKAEMDVMLK